MAENKFVLSKQQKDTKNLSLVSLLKKTIHLIPFFIGFLISRFYSISFPNDIFLIGILISAVLLFTVRNKVYEPPYKEKEG